MKKTNVIRTIDNKTALVSKNFERNASIFGTEEFVLWREYLKFYPDAKMTTRDIKKNPEKRTATKNMTYERMAAYIREQKDCEKLMKDFKKEISKSKIQPNPYRWVLAWFNAQFQNNPDYAVFFPAAVKKEKKDIFALYDDAEHEDAEND
jgi:hypothetical protein